MSGSTKSAGRASRKVRRILVCAGVGGAVVGAVGFVVGYVGPLIFMPDASQGPLIGIFVTGPLGFIVGIIAGALVGALTKEKQDPRNPHYHREGDDGDAA